VIDAADEFAIRDLLVRAAWALDDRDAGGYLSCFTADAIIIAGEELTPLQHLSAHASEPPVLSRQLWNSGVVLADGVEGVEVRSYGTDLSTPKGNPSIAIRAVTDVLDRVVRDGDGWRIRSRTITAAGGGR
jgi:SnoaL-like domain